MVACPPSECFDVDYAVLFNDATPQKGCFQEVREFPIPENSWKSVFHNYWHIGGENGWRYATFLWKLRGALDQLLGGVGYRKGRNEHLQKGQTLDFWEILYAEELERRLLLRAEMKLPGEAWLAFKIDKKADQDVFTMVNTFCPSNVLGTIYWYFVFPFHKILFDGLATRIAKPKFTTQ